MSGARNHHAGAAAEGIVERHYAASGLICLERRWRCKAGEIDLIFEGPEGLIFVEVKAARSLDAALLSLSARQIARIAAAAEAYAHQYATHMKPISNPYAANARIDLAAVDGAGQVAVVENITL